MVERLVEAESVVGSSPTVGTNYGRLVIMVSTNVLHTLGKSSILLLSTKSD